MTHDSHRPAPARMQPLFPPSREQGSNQAVLTVKRVQSSSQVMIFAEEGRRWPVLTRPLQSGGRIIDQKV